MNRKAHTAWLTLALFLAPLVYQSLHRLFHLYDNQHCQGVCQTSPVNQSKLHFFASTHCAVCEYELVLPGQTEPQARIPEIIPVYVIHLQGYTPIVYQQLARKTATRAPPTIS